MTVAEFDPELVKKVERLIPVDFEAHESQTIKNAALQDRRRIALRILTAVAPRLRAEGAEIVLDAVEHVDYFNPSVMLAAAREAVARLEGGACQHHWEVEYLPDPTSGGGVVRSGDLSCADCGATKGDR